MNSEELKTWGWREETPDDSMGDMSLWGLGAAAAALGINGKSKSEGGNNIVYDVHHLGEQSGDQTYSVDGKQYQVRSRFVLFSEY